MAGNLRNDCFALPPGVDWVPVDEALLRLTSRLSCVAEQERISIDQASGRVVAKAEFAQRPHPAHRNAAVDGFAVKLATDPKAQFVLLDGVAAAGRPSDQVLKPGEALRVLTGAKVPEGTDAVVLQEESKTAHGHVLFEGLPKLGANIRPIGEDTTENAEILSVGERLSPSSIAHAISVGIAEVTCYKPLKIGVLSTGDEIVSTGSSAEDYQVYDANRPMLLAQILRWGYQPIDLGHVPDDPGAVETAFRKGTSECDAILTSGGASAGSEDHVASTLQRLADLHTWRIAIKPGRPLAMAQWDGVPIFGLPGNPIAALVCTLIFARPALQILQGRAVNDPAGYTLPAAFAKNKKQGRSEYPRARVIDGQVEIFASEGSGRVSGLHWAKGLVAFGYDACQIKQGDPVRYIPFESFD